ncbi:MAG: hypothetical protein HPY81_03230 [Firmicutes bacterium]|nr:hypothetical protein [Bacillota bacterium]
MINSGLSLFLFILFGVMVVLGTCVLNRRDFHGKLVKTAIQKIEQSERVLNKTNGRVVSSNHPLIGTNEREVSLVITEKFLGIIESADGYITKIPLEQTRARVITADVSPV